VEKLLEELRHNIDEIDQQIVDLLVKRKSEVEKIVALKKTHNLPVYHPAREEDLLSQRRAQAKGKALDPEFVEELFRCILRHSRVEQTARLQKKGIRQGETVLLVGGLGEMGNYFHHWFADSGYSVRILDRDDWASVTELCEDIALALICVPIEITLQVIARLGPHLPQRCVLADITSIKQAPLEAMLQHHGGPVLGLHPLFGPTTSTLDKQLVVATPGRDEQACQWLKDQFAAWGAIVVQCEAREHDAIMSIVQSVRHFATFAFGQFLRKKQIDLARTLEFSSPIYRLELGMVGRLFAQNPGLYAEIIFASPERQQLLKDYLASIQENLAMLAAGDKKAFIEEFTRIAEWFGPFSDQALRESSYLIDRLIERF